MASSTESSGALRRSKFLSDSNTQKAQTPDRRDALPVSPLPFLVCSLYSRHDFLKFSPGAFRRQGNVLDQGATFSVEKHAVADIGINMVDDLVLGEQQAKTHPVVVIKRLRTQAYTAWKTFETVERELSVLKILRGEPNIVQLVGLGWEVAPVNGDTRLWPVLVLEHAEQGSLQNLQRRGAPLGYKTKSRLCADVASGLRSLHRAGLAHGDLKSENVLVFGNTEKTYVAKVSDFGFVPLDYHLRPDYTTEAGPVKHHVGTIGGTEIWAAPEFGQPADLAAFKGQDIYSWGLLVLRVMLDGENPFESEFGDKIPSTEFREAVRRLKLSGAAELGPWILRCLRMRRVRSDVQDHRSHVAGIVLDCLCKRYEESMKPLATDELSGAPKNTLNLPSLTARNAAGQAGLMEEIWCTIKSTDFESLPAKVRDQFLQDLEGVEETRKRLNIPIASSLPAFPSVHLVLTEASMGQVGSRNGVLRAPQFLRLLPQHQHFVSPAESTETPRQQGKKTSGKAFLAATGVKLAIVCVPRQASDSVNSPFTTWHEACALGEDAIVESMFRQHGFDVNATDERGETPLLKACRAGAYRVAMFLLRNGATATTEDGQEDSPLHWLLSFEDSQIPVIAKALVKAGAQMDCQSTAKSWEWDSDEIETFPSGTPLHRAVGRNRHAAVAWLLNLGASPSLMSKYEPYHTPLSLACSLGFSGPLAGEPSSRTSSILSFLLDHLPNYKPNQVYGLSQRRLPSYLLLTSKPQLERLHGTHRVADALSRTLDTLIDRGERLSDPEHGYSLLHVAVKAGRDDVVSLLLQKYQKLDANLTFKEGDMFWQPPLYYAIRDGRKSCFDLLLRSGADPFQRFQTDYLGVGPRLSMETAVLVHDEAAEAFDRKRLRGPRSTYLHACVGNGSGPYFVSKLLAQGLRVNAYDSNWESPLFLAILTCDFESADLLIRHGAATEVLSDDRTMLGHMAEDGFMASYAAYDYILKAQARCGPRGSAGFMAIYKEYRTWLHVLVQFWGSLRNHSWGEALLDLFVGHLPTTDLLDVQCDSTADTALSIAVRDIKPFAVRRLLDWGADPNVPNYNDGYPLDMVLTLVHRRVKAHGLTLQMMKSKDAQSPKIRQAMDEITKLEEIFSLLKDHGAKQGRETPPRDEKERFRMPDFEEHKLRERHRSLRIDLQSVNDDVNTRDGAIDEICKDISSEFVASFKGKTIPAAQGIEIFKKVFASHLFQAPETAHSSRRLFRVQQYLGSLVSQLGCSLHLEFDYKHYGWRFELEELPAGFAGTGIYVLSPPTSGSSGVPLVPIRPEHKFGLATRRADLSKLDQDKPSGAAPMDDIPISEWKPQQLQKPTQAFNKREKSTDPSASTSARAKMGAFELIRFEELLPRKGSRVIVGPDDELASLFFKDNPLPLGYRVMIIALSSGSHFSMTVGIEGKPARAPFLQEVPNGHYFTDADEAKWNFDQLHARRGETTDWSRYGSSGESKERPLDWLPTLIAARASGIHVSDGAESKKQPSGHPPMTQSAPIESNRDGPVPPEGSRASEVQQSGTTAPYASQRLRTSAFRNSLGLPTSKTIEAKSPHVGSARMAKESSAPTASAPVPAAPLLGAEHRRTLTSTVEISSSEKTTPKLETKESQPSMIKPKKRWNLFGSKSGDNLKMANGNGPPSTQMGGPQKSGGKLSKKLLPLFQASKTTLTEPKKAAEKQPSGVTSASVPPHPLKRRVDTKIRGIKIDTSGATAARITPSNGNTSPRAPALRSSLRDQPMQIPIPTSRELYRQRTSTNASTNASTTTAATGIGGSAHTLSGSSSASSYNTTASNLPSRPVNASARASARASTIPTSTTRSAPPSQQRPAATPVTAPSTSGTRRGKGEDSFPDGVSPELLAMLRDIPITIIVNKDDGPGGGRQINSSLATHFASAMATSGRATVVAAGKDDDDETVKRMATSAIERERQNKKDIEARVVPEGMHWWQVRNGDIPGGGAGRYA